MSPAACPRTNLDRARRFCSEKRGLEPAEERPCGPLYRLADGEFRSAAAGSGSFTPIGFDVDDRAAAAADLKQRVSERFDVPGLRMVDGIAEVRGNYPSKGGKGELAA
jgi:hypothetical protein